MKVTVRGVTKVYSTSQGEIRALGGINLEVRDREFFGIIGPTGCGKTTLLHIIGRLEPPSTGIVEFIGEQSAKSPVSMVFQDAALMPWRTVEDNVPLKEHLADEAFAMELSSRTEDFPRGSPRCARSGIPASPGDDGVPVHPAPGGAGRARRVDRVRRGPTPGTRWTPRCSRSSSGPGTSSTPIPAVRVDREHRRGPRVPDRRRRRAGRGRQGGAARALPAHAVTLSSTSPRGTAACASR